ncbi:hypothetical protein C0991_000025 [Blastosporella zonata]|nr:hypothetical protein C0991_000025 [Blastosporella zonata]
MSSFKRKGSVKQAPVLSGTRVSPATSSTIITSTGIPSFDDILGGGLPLSCSTLIAAPDLHSSYGDLVQKYFVAQGLTSQHRLYVVDSNAEAFVKDIMWIPSGRNGATPDPTLDEDDQVAQQGDQKIKIAWRYEQMKPFQTTVPASSSSSTGDYCYNFDLSSRVPTSVIEKAHQSGQLSFLTVRSSGRTSICEVLNGIKGAFSSEPSGTSSATSPIRVILREHPYACASISLAPHVSSDAWGGSGWLQKLGWVTDAAFTLAAFSGMCVILRHVHVTLKEFAADPSLTMTFPNHHGLLHVHTLPAPHSILPPSDKFSTLRGLSASAGGTGGSGENNLTFKSTRKRLIFETLHLDIEGGVGERRTTPSTTAVEIDDTHAHTHDDTCHTSKGPAFAAVQVALEASEDPRAALNATDGGEATGVPEGKPKKPKKKVAFRADRPDLYDF